MGGVVGGLVGGIFGGGGGILGGVMNSVLGNIVNDLVDQFGLTDISNALNNLAADLLQTGLNAMIDNLPIPGFLKDMAKDVIGNIVDQARNNVSSEAQSAVNEELGGTVGDIVGNFLDFVQESMEDEVQGGEGNWLVALAKALGEASGKHLKNMVELGEKMGGMDATEDEEAFAETQAMFQAESQIFKMFQEFIATMIKSIGEGMSTIARKQ